MHDMGNVVDWFLRSRFAMLLILMISDVNAFLSVIFVVQSAMLSASWKYGLIVHGIGLLLYALKTLHFGPQQKYRMIKMVRKLVSGMEEIDSDWLKTAKLNKENFERCKREMATHGLMEIWNYCEELNGQKNREMIHGVPFLRLARFGYMERPSAKDVEGIFAANSMFTYCIGIWQLIYGTIILAEVGEVKIEMLPPLCASLICFVLTVMNIAMNFNKKLAEIGHEDRRKKKVWWNAERNRVALRTQAKCERNAKLKEIDSQPQDATDLVAQEMCKLGIESKYELRVQAIEDSSLAQLEADLSHFEESKAMRKRSEQKPKLLRMLSRHEQYEDMKDAIVATRSGVLEHHSSEVSIVTVESMTPEEYAQRLTNLGQENETRLRAIEQRLENARESFNS